MILFQAEMYCTEGSWRDAGMVADEAWQLLGFPLPVCTEYKNDRGGATQSMG